MNEPINRKGKKRNSNINININVCVSQCVMFGYMEHGKSTLVKSEARPWQRAKLENCFLFLQTNSDQNENKNNVLFSNYG